VEAMSQGLIPVVFPIGVAPEIIKNGHNGYIVNSVDEMVRKIKKIINNPSKRQSLAEEAIKTSMQFNADVFVDKLVDIYKELKNSPKIHSDI
jgi:glycosyltransferase involved in cell wall biosynthesis